MIKLKLNKKLISYNDTLYIKQNDIVPYYGYARVVGISEYGLSFECKSGECFTIKAENFLDTNIDFVHKEIHLRNNPSLYLIEE
jgi:hypothetical protein